MTPTKRTAPDGSPLSDHPIGSMGARYFDSPWELARWDLCALQALADALETGEPGWERLVEIWRAP